MFKAYQSKNLFLYLNQQIYIIQNSLRIIDSKRIVGQKKNILTCLSLHMQIYMTKLKKIHRKKMKLVSEYIINQIKEKIIYREYNNLWNKIQPFFIRLLAEKKNIHIFKHAKGVIMGEKYSRSIKIMQFNLLMKKNKQIKEKIKYIFNYSSTKILSKYYLDLIKNILIIQRYMNVKLNKKKIIEKINKDYFSDEQQSLLLTENKDANEILFPFTLESEYNEEENSTNINDKNLNNYFDNKNTKKNKDNSMLRTLKSNDYYRITISDNKTPNMTTLDRTRNIHKNKLISILIIIQ